jgi:uncharacterized protein (DUF4415 family)
MRKEYDLKKLKAKPHPRPKGLKVAIHVRLDVHVVAWLRRESEKTGLPYQTFLNFTLRQAMSRSEDSLSAEQIRTIVREEIKKVS